MSTLGIGKLLQSVLKHRVSSLRQISLSVSCREAVNPGSTNHRVNNLEKRFLVWTGKYKSVADVPNFINPEVMERARNRIRIRIANLMIVTTIIGCIAMVISGKKASERGESVVKDNLDWHKKYNEQKAREN